MEPPNDGGHDAHEEFRHPQHLKNPTPGYIVELYSCVTQFLQSYGWFILIGFVLCLYAKRRLQQYLASRPSSSTQPQDLHRYDSETVLRRQEAFEASRRRLQEVNDAKAAKFAEEQKKKEEEKRKEKIAEWDRHLEGKGYRSKYRPPEEPSSVSSGSASGSSASGSSASSGQPSKNKKSTYKRSDYNPLMGDGGGSGSSGYRPPARRGGGG